MGKRYMFWKWGFWFVVLNYKIALLGPKDPILFSERNGYSPPFIKIWKLRLFITALPHSKLISIPSVFKIKFFQKIWKKLFCPSGLHLFVQDRDENGDFVACQACRKKVYLGIHYTVEYSEGVSIGSPYVKVSINETT